MIVIFPFVLYCGLAAIFSTQGGQLTHILCFLMRLSSFIFIDLGLICGFPLWKFPLDIVLMSLHPLGEVVILVHLLLSL